MTSKYINKNRLELNFHNIEEITCKLTSIIKYIYHNLPLDYDEMERLYFDSNSSVDFDFKKDCRSAGDRSYINRPKFVPNISDNKYIYRFVMNLTFNKYYWNEQFNELKESNTDPDKNFDYCFDLTNEIHEYLKENTAKDLIISGVIGLKLVNTSGINTDSRGIREVDWKLSFWEKYKIYKETDVTLHDLIIAAYKIRSHKFEDWYEMFCELGNIKIKETDNGKMITMFAKFDHGS